MRLNLIFGPISEPDYDDRKDYKVAGRKPGMSTKALVKEDESPPWGEPRGCDPDRTGYKAAKFKGESSRKTNSGEESLSGAMAELGRK